MAHERGGCGAARSRAAFLRTGDRARTSLVIGRAAAPLRLLTGRAGAPLRPQYQLGFAAPELSRAAPGKHSTAGACGQDSGASGHEVSGARGTYQPGRLPAHGRHLCRASIGYAPGRPALCRLARGLAGYPQTHFGASRAVLQDTAGTAGGGSRRPVARSGYSRRDGETRPSPAGCRGGRCPGLRARQTAMRDCPLAGRPHAEPTGTDRSKTSTGASTTC